MLTEIQNLINSTIATGKQVQLILNYEHKDMELVMNIFYISYEKSWIIIHSELAVLKLRPDFIASIGTTIIISAHNSFVTKIIFPENQDEEKIELIDESIRKINKILKSHF